MNYHLFEVRSIGGLVCRLLADQCWSFEFPQDLLVRPKADPGEDAGEGEDGEDELLEVGDVRPLEHARDDLAEFPRYNLQQHVRRR